MVLDPSFLTGLLFCLTLCGIQSTTSPLSLLHLDCSSSVYAGPAEDSRPLDCSYTTFHGGLPARMQNKAVGVKEQQDKVGKERLSANLAECKHGEHASACCSTKSK